MGVQFAGNILASSAGGPLPIAMGGTGQTNAPAAINALLPSQVGQSTKVLTTDGTNVSWQDAAGGGGTPGGADTQIQYNDAGVFGGISAVTVNKSTGALTSTSSITSASSYISGAAGTTRTLGFQTAGSNRWLMQVSNAAESGSNVGSDFALVRISDNGATTNQVINIARNTGVVDFKVAPTINGATLNASITSLTAITSIAAPNATGPGDSGKDLAISAGDASFSYSNGGSITLTSKVGTPLYGGPDGHIALVANGTGAAGGAYVSVSTNSTERLRILADGSWSVGSTGAAVGSAGQVLTSNGTGAAPTWQSAPGAAASTLTGTTLASNVVNSSLTSVGTVTTGTWNATTISPTKGGTGITSYAPGDIIYASATNTLSILPKGQDGQVLTLSSGAPVWAASQGGGGGGGGTGGSVALSYFFGA